MNTSELVQPRHLIRSAEIYVRQSSRNQVLTNKESQRMQYALRDRACSLGWQEHDIHVIDDDLGRSGASIEGREGYQKLVARIALGKVGILLAFDATRLARNCSHWYQLLDLCGLHDCLIADRDGVYDPTSINGRLLLGLPTGLVRADGIATKHPSAEVRERIDLIFSTFMQQKSVSQTVRWFVNNDLLLPRRDHHGDVHWKRVTSASVSCFLNNPAYAGAAAYGRTRWKKSQNNGKMQEVNLPRNQWRYCVQDKFPAYILKQQTGAATCQRIPGDAIDDWVVTQFFKALSVAEIDVAAEALRVTDAEYEQVVVARRQQVERLRYASTLAERQFMKSDPDNRLVTGELERRWEASLRELHHAEQQLAEKQEHAPSYMIPADILEMLRDVGPSLPELWNAKLLKTSQQKSLLRSLVEKVVIHRLAPDQIQTRIVWRGGITTSEIVRVTVGKFAWLTGAQEMEASIEKLAREGRSDKEIASHLSNAGHCSPRADKVLESMVRNVRLQNGILRRASQSHPRRVSGFLTIPQLAKKLGISRWWISDRINNGTIQVTKDEKTKCYLFPDTTEKLAELKTMVAAYRTNLGCGKGHQDE